MLQCTQRFCKCVTSAATKPRIDSDHSMRGISRKRQYRILLISWGLMDINGMGGRYHHSTGMMILRQYK